MANTILSAATTEDLDGESWYGRAKDVKSSHPPELTVSKTRKQSLRDVVGRPAPL